MYAPLDSALAVSYTHLTTLTDPSRFGLALVLGGAEVKLIDLTSAFGVFGQEGIRQPADGIKEIIDRDGKNIYTERGKSDTVLDTEVARDVYKRQTSHCTKEALPRQ